MSAKKKRKRRQRRERLRGDREESKVEITGWKVKKEKKMTKQCREKIVLENLFFYPRKS